MEQEKIPIIAYVTLYLGISSLIVFLLSIILGLTIESMGIISLFFIATCLGVGAIICAVNAKKKIDSADLLAQKYLKLGLMLGIAVVVTILIVQLIIYIFFTQMFKG